MSNNKQQLLFDPDLKEKPYSNQLEYIAELTALIDLKIKKFIQDIEKISINEAKASDSREGVSLIEVSKIINSKLNHIYKYSEATEFIFEVDAYIGSRRIASAKDNKYFPVDYICDAFSLSDFGRHCLILSLLSYLDSDYEKIFSALNESREKKQPTLQLAVSLFNPFGYVPTSAHHIIQSEINQLLELLPFATECPEDFSIRQQILASDKRLVDFIFEPFGKNESLLTYSEYFSPCEQIYDVVVAGENLKKIEEYVKNADGNKVPFFFLSGPEGAGKKFAVKSFCSDNGMDAIFVDMGVILEDEKRNLETELWHLARECRLRQLVVCLHNVHLIPSNRLQKILDIVISRLRNVSRSFFMISEEEKYPGNKRMEDMLELNFEMPSNLQRKIFWKAFSSKFKLEESVDIAALANKFRFTPGQIISTLNTASSETTLAGRQYIMEDIIYKSCYKQIKHGLSERASKVNIKYGWNDLILADKQKRMLKDACDQIRYRHIVYGEWDFDSKIAYGKGMSILFSGLPGTGKTMAAQVVAKELSLELYKIDLSRIVDKYIGETEKNIRGIFEEAKKCNVILFFDEADALFGKRSEVKDSHDKYANIETSFLLQAVEEYEGVSILATNNRNNMDDAFKRRINFMIEFPFPDATVRLEIWRAIFPKKAPIDTNLDFEFIADNFELAGGNIKNAAVAAAFLAAAEGHTIEMKHLLRAIKREYAKIGKLLLEKDLGHYALMMGDRDY